MYTLQLLGIVFYRCQLGKMTDSISYIFFVLAENFWEGVGRCLVSLLDLFVVAEILGEGVGKCLVSRLLTCEFKLSCFIWSICLFPFNYVSFCLHILRPSFMHSSIYYGLSMSCPF